MLSIMSRFSSAILAVLFSSLLSVSANAELPTVLIEIDGTGQFDVLHSRANSTATGAALFGLIGAGVEAGSRSSADTKLEKELEPHLSNTDCHAVFVDSLVARLEEKGFQPVLQGASDSNADFDYLMRIKLRNCGFKMTNTESKQMSAFYYANFGIADTGGKRPKLQDLLVTGRAFESWSNMIESPERCNSEFDEIRRKAGRRIANKLIYRK